MAPALALLLFTVSVVVTLAAAAFFADRLDHLGPRIGLPESLVGLLTAFAADAPEISSALVALAGGEKAVSLGVLTGSNAFNLAAMIGLSAILTGSVRIGRRSLLVEGAVGLLTTLIAGAVILDLVPAGIAVAALALVLAPYVAFLSKRSVEDDDPAPAAAARSHPTDQALWRLVGLILVAVALIVIGATGMVESALSIAHHWDIPEALVGILILAVLTSLPNSFTAVRLALGDRDPAMVSETLNSNNINLAAGVMLPALIVGLEPASGIVKFDLLWLLVMTVAALLFLARPRGAGRLAGAALVALYLVFVVVQIARA